MAQPTPYVPGHDFSTELGNAHGTNLDVEFASLQTTLGETLDNLEMIQRDDGALKNGIVTRDALHNSIIMGIGTPTTWVTATEYAAYDSVIRSNIWYFCEEGHTSSSFTSDLAAGYWTQILDLSTFQTAAAASAAAAAQAVIDATSLSAGVSTAVAAAVTAQSAAATSATNAATSATAAAASATDAAASAAAAAGSSVRTTSTTSHDITTGALTFTVANARDFGIGQFLYIAETADPANYMIAQVTAWNGVSSLSVNSVATSGSGTGITAWTIGLSGPVGAGVVDIDGLAALTGLASGDELVIYDASASSNKKVTMTNLLAKLFGNLDVNGNNITSSSNGNINIAPNGTGEVQLSGEEITKKLMLSARVYKNLFI